MKFSQTKTTTSLLERHKVNTHKLEQSQEVLKYRFQNFFSNNVIVPSIHIGEASRESGKRSTDSTSFQQRSHKPTVQHPPLNNKNGPINSDNKK